MWHPGTACGEHLIRRETVGMVCRSGSNTNTTKASQSPEFVAPRPRANILRGPSPGTTNQTLQTTTAELDKLAATLKQVQHDITMSMPPDSAQAAAARPEAEQAPAQTGNRGSRRNVFQLGGAAARGKSSPPAVKPGKGSAGRSAQPGVNTSDVSEPREPLAEVTNGAKLHDAAEQGEGHVAADQAAARKSKGTSGKADAAGKAGVADEDHVADRPVDGGATEPVAQEKAHRKPANGSDKARRKKVSLPV